MLIACCLHTVEEMLMRELLSIELKRAFGGSGMVAASMIGCALAVHHFAVAMMNGCYLAGFDSEAEQLGAMVFAPDFLWGCWMGADGTQFHGYLLILLMPVLAGLPHAASYLEDRVSGYLTVVFSHGERRTYYASKWAATFLSGGVVSVIPFALNFLLFLTVYPVVDPVVGSGHCVANVNTIFSSVYFEHPLEWVALWLSVFFISGGLMATLGLAVTPLTEYRLVVHVLPFLIMYIIGMVLGAFGLGRFGILTLIDPLRNEGGLSMLACELASMLLLSVVVLGFVCIRRSDLA